MINIFNYNILCRSRDYNYLNSLKNINIIFSIEKYRNLLENKIRNLKEKYNLVSINRENKKVIECLYINLKKNNLFEFQLIDEVINE